MILTYWNIRAGFAVSHTMTTIPRNKDLGMQTDKHMYTDGYNKTIRDGQSLEGLSL